MDKTGDAGLKERMFYTGIYISGAILAARLFYDSFYAVLLFIPAVPIYIRMVRKICVKKNKEVLAEQFMRCLTSVSTSMSAGISAENAFLQAKEDMEKLFGRRSLIARELEIVNSHVSVGDDLNEALNDLANRVKIPEISDFVIVFTVARKRGGDFSAIISSCVSIMEAKRQAENEARVLIRAKQYEQRVMCIIPPGILLYLKLSSGNFMKVLYHNAAGIAIMSVCLVVYIVAIVLSEKIGDVSI